MALWRSMRCAYDAPMRSSSTLAHIPVLMLTALRRPEDVARARDLGASDYLVKPFDTRLLLRRLRTMLIPGARAALVGE